jgi:hypothetical protein
MNTLPIQTFPGRWTLVSGMDDQRAAVLAFIASSAGQGPVRVLDCGRQFNIYRVARPLRGRKNLLDRVSISRAFTCYQVFTSLENIPDRAGTFVAMDFLHSFYDESVRFKERRRLLERCLPHLVRICAQSGGVVSVHQPAVPSSQADTLIGTVKAAADKLKPEGMSPSDPETLEIMPMGNITPTSTQVYEEELEAYSLYRRALRDTDQMVLDDLFTSARQHLSAVQYAAHALPFETLLLSMLLEEHKKVLFLLHEYETIIQRMGLSPHGTE